MNEFGWNLLSLWSILVRSLFWVYDDIDMTTDTLVGAILTSPCVRVTPAVLVGGLLGPGSSTSIGSLLRRAKTKKKRVKEILSFFASEFSFLKTYLREKKMDRCRHNTFLPRDDGLDWVEYLEREEKNISLCNSEINVAEIKDQKGPEF